MARILEKALTVGGEPDDRRAMGIAISGGGAPPSAARNLYLDGYGALFFLDVNFPLIPPPKRTEETKVKAPPSSEWEEARRELDAARSPERQIGKAFLKDSGRAGGVEYDEEKVEQLKDDLLESLKNATHIRDLKPEESITVVVTGNSQRGPRRVTRKSGGDGWNTQSSVETVHHEVVRVGGGHAESTLTLRVKKADAEAFSEGKLDLDAFRKRAIVQTY